MAIFLLLAMVLGSQVHAEKIGTLKEICERSFADNKGLRARCLKSPKSPQIVHECTQPFSTQDAQMACIDRVKSPGIVSACMQAFPDSKGAREACLGTDASPVIVGECGALAKMNDAKLRCLGLAKHPGVVGACSRAFNGTGYAFEDCLKTGKPAEIIQDCDKLPRMDDVKLRCMRQVRSAGVATACSRAFPASKAMDSCLSTSKPVEDVIKCTTQFADPSRALDCVGEAKSPPPGSGTGDASVYRGSGQKRDDAPAGSPASDSGRSSGTAVGQ